MGQPASNLGEAATETMALLQKPNVATEVWRGYRPYLVAVTVASLVAITLWVPLFVFEKLMGWRLAAARRGRAVAGVSAGGHVQLCDLGGRGGEREAAAGPL